MTDVAVQTTPSPSPTDPHRFINRELSWLNFNGRVVEEAQNERHPLLERVRFISIAANNLDEFLMTRVASLEEMLADGEGVITDDGLSPAEHIQVISYKIETLQAALRAAWDNIREELIKRDIVILAPDQLDAEDQAWISAYFHKNIFIALSPLAVDPAHPFPFIPNGSVALALEVRDPVKNTDNKIILPLPTQLNRIIRLPPKATDRTIRFVVIEDVVKRHLDVMFPNLQILSYGEFRVLRNSEIDMVNEKTDDLVTSFESAVKSRYRGDVIRLNIAESTPEHIRQFLIDELEVEATNMNIRNGMLRLTDLRQIIVRDRPDLCFTPYTPRYPERISEFNGDAFSAISHKDIIIHHPYESFDVVLHFIRQAIKDPDVVAIKQTLYRTGKNSPIVKALIEAAEAGKSVTVVVELKARFDEEANIRWARDLERVGAQVVFGFMELKTHAKMTLVVRREDDVLRTFAHFGTGNYHSETARVYTDLSFFTCDPVLCQDAAALFNYMTGYAPPGKLQKIAAAPLNIREAITGLIDKEIKFAQAGKPATIWAKMNALVDAPMIDKLYEASQAGVKIELVVRGACCLRPGVKGLSENITVKSMIGRFLEHSRIVAFGNGYKLPSDKAKVYISSADWMPRNFNRRIETFIPIENQTVHRQVLDQILMANLMDTRQSWYLLQDGTYKRASTAGHDFCAHDYFMKNPSLSGRGVRSKKKTLPPNLILSDSQ
ncbi:MAG: RNA degradosome polyphosphate kinase [Alphaproteobacteria bacterium]|nr:RNA degradosome polyphosphate kinase [Alphaproteobacteria bacterium]MBV8548626.1 RNA degradosome polyphosphate kinase [Alphaproteobacteria bacterium]